MSILSTFNYYLDIPVKFFFMQSKSEAISDIYTASRKNSLDQAVDLEEALKIHRHQIRRYMGFGFLASFIPGTEAFTARLDCLRTLNAAHEKAVTMLEDNTFRPAFFQSLLTPFYFIQDFFDSYYVLSETAPSNIHVNRKDTLGDLLSYFPFISDVIRYSSRSGRTRLTTTWPQNLARSIFNPLRIISSLLRFLHRTLDAIFELGAEMNVESSIIRKILKGLSAFIFLPTRFLVSLVENTINLILGFVYNITIEPLRFIYESIKQFVETWSEDFVYMPKEEYQGVQQVRKAVKAASKKQQAPDNQDDLQNEDDFKLMPLKDYSEKRWVIETENYCFKIISDKKSEAYSNYAQFFNDHSKENMMTSNKTDQIAKTYNQEYSSR